MDVFYESVTRRRLRFLTGLCLTRRGSPEKRNKIMATPPGNDEYIDISESAAMRTDAPWYGNTFDAREFGEIAEGCINAIKSSTSPRQVVLESWLLVDYAIHQLLAGLWGLKKFNNDDAGFDLRYELLPSFERCTRLLERILTIQRSLPEDPHSHAVTFPVKFIFFFKKNYPNEFSTFAQIEQDYYRRYYPNLATASPEIRPSLTTMSISPTVLQAPPAYCVNKGWVDALRDLDESWFQLARRLNKARNVAAHSYSASKILLAFGHAGPNAAEQTNRECMKMLGILLGVVEKREEASPGGQAVAPKPPENPTGGW